MALRNRVWRVKVYQLEGDGEWADRGTGYLDIEGAEVSVFNEDSPDMKILHYWVKDEEYRKQGDTILTWVDESRNTFALSFQEQSNAKEVLEEICKIQSKNPCDISNEDEVEENPCLIEPKMDNLQEIAMTISFSNKAKLAKEVLGSGFLNKMHKVIDKIREEENEKISKTGNEKNEDSKNSQENKDQKIMAKKTALEMTFLIYKQFFHLNSPEILEELLSDEHFSYVLLGLEHDPGLNGIVYDLKNTYYESRHNNLLVISDELFLAKVCKAHRLQFIRDMALGRSLDDSATTFIFFIQQSLWKDIISFYVTNDAIRNKLCSKLENNEPGALEFLMELCNIAKSCIPQLRHDLYEILFKDGVIIQLETLSRSHEKEKVLEFLGEMYSNVLDLSPFLLKNMFFSQNCSLGNSLLQHIANSLLSSKNLGTIQELGQLIRLLLEPDTNVYYDRILEYFYKDICPMLISNLNRSTSEDILSEVLTILTYCVETHSERIRLLLVLSDILSKVSTIATNSKHLSIYILKFFRAVIRKNEKSVNEILVRNSLIDCIFEIFIENSTKQGMLFSLVLTILEILKNTNSVVLKYVIKKFLPRMKEKALDGFFGKLVEEFKRQKNNQSVLARPNQRDEQDSDQDYFDESSDEEMGLKRKSAEEFLPVKKRKIVEETREA